MSTGTASSSPAPTAGLISTATCAGVQARRAARVFIIGSRKSELAQIQAYHVRDLLAAAHPGTTFEVQTEVTAGDVNLVSHLATLAGAAPGLFTKELEMGLATGAYDLVVHSLKDMPTTLPTGLSLAAITSREDPRDVLILKQQAATAAAAANVPNECAGASTNALTGSAVAEAARADGADSDAVLHLLPAGMRLGTSSVRREALLRRLAPQATAVTIRGNLNTRMRKLDTADEAAPEAAACASAPPTVPAAACAAVTSAHAAAPTGVYDALLLARAGIQRLGWGARITHALNPDVFPYAVGQGALGIEVRADDEEVAALLLLAVDVRAALACTAERTFLNKLQGGCQVPIGVKTTVGGVCASAPSPWSSASAEGAPRATELHLSGSVLSLDGGELVTVNDRCVIDLPVLSGANPACPSVAAWRSLTAQAAALGSRVGEAALRAGADRILGHVTSARPITYGSAELAGLTAPLAAAAAAAAAAGVPQSS
ncbi:hypothetical protein EON68_00360 [archaeon]|nr:MAG: hypothetical protein EON68_00360 [archaeon]